MQLPGIVTNITAFGAFCGHRRQAGRIRSTSRSWPTATSPPAADVVHLGQHVEVRGDGIDYRPQPHFVDHAQGRLGRTPPPGLRPFAQLFIKAPSQFAAFRLFRPPRTRSMCISISSRSHTEFGAVGRFHQYLPSSRGSVKMFSIWLSSNFEHQFGRKRPHPVVHHHRIVDVELLPVIDPVERVVEINRGLRRELRRPDARCDPRPGAFCACSSRSPPERAGTCRMEPRVRIRLCKVDRTLRAAETAVVAAIEQFALAVGEIEERRPVRFDAVQRQDVRSM